MLADAQVDLIPIKLEPLKKAAGLASTLPKKLEWQHAAPTLEGNGKKRGARINRLSGRLTGRRMCCSMKSAEVWGQSIE